jgi:peptidoglycan/LPS O-acetylase OafA/YrhL
VPDQHGVKYPPGAAKAAIAATPRLVGLDGSRGIACLAIIAAHTSVHFTPKAIARTHLDLVLGHAVTFFFVLSAFLLYLPYVRRLIDGRTMPRTSTYLRRRFLRIFPAYLVIFLFANFVLQAVFVQNPSTVGWSNGDAGTGMITNPAQLLTNLTLTQTLLPAYMQTGINPSWTLTVEWGFYLALPVIGVMVFERAKKSARPLRAALIPAAVMLMVGIVTQIIAQTLQSLYYPSSALAGSWGPNWTAVLSRSSLAYASVFAVGMVTAITFVALANGRFKSVPTLRLQWTIACLVLVAGIGAAVMFLVNPHYVETLVGLASAAFILLIVAPLARGEHSALARVTDWLPLRAVGVITLSAYLWHYPVLTLVGRLPISFPDNYIGMVGAFVIVAAASGLLGSLTYRFVEKPMSKFRE